MVTGSGVVERGRGVRGSGFFTLAVGRVWMSGQNRGFSQPPASPPALALRRVRAFLLGARLFDCDIEFF